MAGEGTSDKDLWIGVVGGSHSNISSECLFAVAGRHDESSGDDGSTAEVGARFLEGYLPWSNSGGYSILAVDNTG